jgi:hypothetical protein
MQGRLPMQVWVRESETLVGGYAPGRVGAGRVEALHPRIDERRAETR